MAKKQTKKAEATQPGRSVENIPPELEKKLKAIKTKVEKFKKKVLDKFDEYVVGISLLPPEKKPEEKEENLEKDINLLVLIDDTTSQKMTKDELHHKISTLINKMAKDIDDHLKPQTLLLTDLWRNCYDGKYEILRMISLGAPVHDTGMLSAIKIAEVHKTMVLKKFEKYIVSYVLAGSLVQGKATPTSDIDVWIVIDDTDVKKMTRAELKDKLRAIIIGMGIEAGDLTGIKNKLNIQVYILTDFWDSLKEANPIIFTLLRDGVPFYDRGLFMPWKLMLRMGKIKPSREAIDLFKSAGSQAINRVKFKLKDIAMEDLYYAMLTPSQAALMMYGLPPPTPRETPEVLREIFVRKEKLLQESYVKMLEQIVAIRKDIEHGAKKELTGKEVDDLLQNADKYLKRLDQLFKQIEKTKNEESVIALYDEVVTVIRNVLKMEGIEKAKDDELIKIFEDELISSGKVPARYLRDLNEIIAAKKSFDKGKLTKAEIEKAKKGSAGLYKYLVEYMQRKRGKALERAKIKVKHGNTYGEVTLLDDVAFIIKDIDEKEKRVQKAVIQKDGSFGPLEESSWEEFEHHLARTKFPRHVFIKEAVFDSIKDIFGRDVEVLVNY
jgi:uncharacterized protein (UPF0332 family)/predicted nucleotidyltransferase